MVRVGGGEVGLEEELNEEAKDSEIEGGMEEEVGSLCCPNKECYHRFWCRDRCHHRGQGM